MTIQQIKDANNWVVEYESIETKINVLQNLIKLTNGVEIILKPKTEQLNNFPEIELSNFGFDDNYRLDFTKTILTILKERQIDLLEKIKSL